jgi:hypothetical protein
MDLEVVKEMTYKNLTTVFLLILAISLGLRQNVDAQTRLGLHLTQEELNIWKQRAQSGPYRSLGDVSTNSPGDWDRIVSNANAFGSNPSNGRWTNGPTLLTGSCVAKDTGGTNDPPSSVQGWAQRVRDAAFYDRIMGVTTHQAAIKQELLWQAQASWANWSNTSRWCTGVIWDINPGFIITAWLTKLLFAYDYIGRNAFTTSELSIMDTWFWNAANFWRIDMDYSQDSRFVNRWAGDYTLKTTCSGGIIPYLGGPSIQNFADANNNRRGSILRCISRRMALPLPAAAMGQHCPRS